MIVKSGHVYVLALTNASRSVMYMYTKPFNWLEDTCTENPLENSLADLNKIAVTVLLTFG